MAMVQFIETTESKLSSVSIKYGQLIYTDTGKAYFDSSSNQRVELTNLGILATDAARTSLTNPVVNKFYFVKTTSKLYLYVGSWVLINKDQEKYTLPAATSTALGGVKSGTDITVDASGNVTVNNNSHTHTIENITNLQSTLDGKETAGAAASALTEAKAYADSVGATVKNDLLGGAGDAYDSLMELANLIADNKEAIDALREIASGKADKDHTHNYAGSSTVGGAANSANKLNTDAGDENTPVYFKNGVPVPVTSISVDTQGNAETATSLATARKITLAGDASGSVEFDGSEDVTLTVTVADDSHAHTIANVDGLQAALDAKEAAGHTHPAYENQNAFSNVKVGSTTIAADTVTDTLTIAAGANVTITPDATNDKITIAATDTTYNAATSTTAGLMSAADKAKLDTIDEGANNFTMPIAGSNFGAVKTTSLIIESGGYTACPIIDGVPYYKTDIQYTLASFNVTASSNEINKLDGITVSTEELNYLDGVTSAIQTQLNNKAAKTHTHDNATNTAAGFMSAADKTKLNNIDENANNYILPTASRSVIGGVKTTSNVTSTSGLTACPIIDGVPYYKDTDTTYTLSSFGITATAAELNKLDGVTATTAEINYLDGVTSAIQTQLNTKADADHTHAYAAVASDGVSAVSAARLVVDAGDANTPVYFKDGVPTTCSSDLTVDTKGNAATATALQTARSITLAGDATGTVEFDGSTDVTLTVTVKDDSHAHVIGNVDGLQAALDGKETAGAAANALTEAKSYADTVGTNVKNEILGGAGEAFDTLVELSELITDNTDAIDALETVAAGKADKVHSHDVATTSAAGFMSAADKSKLDGIAAGANKYSHPTYTAKTAGFYKVTVDGTGHVSAATAVAKSDITALGIPAQDTTYSAATTSAAGLMSAADKTKLEGIATGANKYSHPTYTSKAAGFYKVTVDGTGHVSAATAVTKDDITGLGIPAQDTVYTLPTAGSTLGGVKTTSTVTSTSGLTACPIIGGVPYYKDTNDTYTLSSFGVTATAAELNTLDGITATVTELNYMDGVTSNVQTQLNGKLSTSGGTLTGDVTMNKGASSQSDEPSFKWKTIGENTPYFGFAKDQTDGTFVLSLRGTNYASGLAIGGGSTNLLWKGIKVATVNDIPSITIASEASIQALFA